MTSAAPSPETRRRALAVWLWTVAVLVFAMVLVGGATRLTESGLSIVEWKPVTGVLPPLSASDWQAEFSKYQAIPQYQQRRAGMTLDQFKVIYWWEWAHRLLGRVVGTVFLLPLLWFAWKGWIGPGLRRRLWLIFGLGALQGIAGWWMVASGLTDRVSVSQYRLAFHLTLACIIFAAIVWTAQRLRPHVASDFADGKRAPARRQDLGPLNDPSTRLRAFALGLVVLVLCQIYLGALVAGLHAGLVYNTWPLIDGSLVPAASRLFFDEPWWRNFFENTLMVQFVHRTVAYALWSAAVLHAIDAARARRGGTPLVLALALAALVTVQAALGIAMLLQQAPIGLALTHQAVAVAVLTIAVVHAERLSPPSASAQAQAALRPSTHLG